MSNKKAQCTQVTTRMTVHNNDLGKPISQDLWGIFLEDINYAVDGGLNADLLQNGAFEYNHTDNPRWSHLFGWSITHHNTGYRDVSIRMDDPVAKENPHHVALRLNTDIVTLTNRGFDGMTLTAGLCYECAAWVRAEGADMTLTAELIDEAVQHNDNTNNKGNHSNSPTNDGTILARKEIAIPAYTITNITPATNSDADSPTNADSHGWRHIYFMLDCAGSTTQGALRLTITHSRTRNSDVNYAAVNTTPAETPSTPISDPIFRIDWVSLKPCDSNRHPCIFREDLVQSLRDLSPRFMRFPGGCITHGVETDNIYRWKRTVGPVEHRPHQYSYWGYHQSFTIGFYEYFLLCETIGAKPLPILPVGVSCQNTAGGVTTVPMEYMDDFVQDALDLIEYANGTVDSPWGAQRAAAGHPEPFGLEYLGLGNEDQINEAFRERFSLIHDAVKRKYPNITIIGTVGPNPSGNDYDAGRDFARRKQLDMVDEHAYKSPQWWFSNLDHYDGRNPHGPATYLGEYGSWSNLQISALAEAAIMSSIERNGDTVRMASYAPLFGRLAHTQWHPDLIYFDGKQVLPTLNYWVQCMYAHSPMTHVLETTVLNPPRFEAAPRDWTGLRFSSVDMGTFVFSNISVTELSATGSTMHISHIPDMMLRGAGTNTDTGIHVDANNYRINFTARRTDGEDGLIIDFGTVDGPDYFRWAFGDWGNKYYILKRVGDGIPNEVVPAYEGGIESNRDYTVEIEVADQGNHVQVWLNGQMIHDYRDASKQTRFVAQSGRNVDTGELIVRIVNATDQTTTLDLNLTTTQHLLQSTTMQSPALSQSAHMTVLYTDWNNGKPFEKAPIEPVTTSVSYADLQELPIKPYSFTVLRIPEYEKDTKRSKKEREVKRTVVNHR